MATQTLEFTAATGLTISCKLFALGSDTVVATATATEKTNNKSRYSVAYTDVPAGAYVLNGFVSGVGGFAAEVYDLTLTTSTFYPRAEASLSVTTTVTPLAAGEEQRVEGTDITAYVGELSSITVYSVVDADDNPVDLSVRTLRVYIQEQGGGEVLQTIEDANVTVSGANNNNFTFTPTAAVVAIKRKLDWSLRDVGNGERNLAYGVLDIKRAAWQ